MEPYTWRPLTGGDHAALAALEAAARAADGPASVPDPMWAALVADPTVRTVGAVLAGDGPLIAAGWAQTGGGPVRLGGKVHPMHRRRGLGTQLLRRTEQAGAAGSGWVIRNEAFGAGSAALYAQEGYTCDFVEQWMQRDLSTLPPAAPVPLPCVSWTPETAPAFFAAYRAAFATRPGFRPPGATEWIADYVGDPDFRPDLSLLTQDGTQPAGFLAAEIVTIADLEQTVGWVAQVGVVPGWRGRGLGVALLTAAMAAFRHAGLPAVGLHVNVNNPEAIGLYTRLGFAVRGRRAKYSKPAAPDML